MAVTTTDSRKQYTQGPGGATTEWPVDFKFSAKEDLVVVTTVGGVDTTLTLDTDYSVTGAGLDAGGTVTIDPPIAAGTRLTIYRQTDLDQPTVLPSSGGWFPKVHEAVFDRIVMQMQQLHTEIDLCAKLPITDTSDPANFITEVRAAVASTAADAVSCAEAASDAADAAAIVTANQTKLDNVTSNLTAIQNAATNAATATTQAGLAQGYAEDADEARAAAVIAQGLAEDAQDAAETAQAAAEAAASNVSVRKSPPITATAGQTVVTPGFTWNDAAGNIVVYIDGLKQAVDTYTLTSPTLTLSEALAGGETIEVYSIDFTAAPGTPLFASQNLADLNNVGTARTNMGLGDSATKNVGTAAGTVCAGDDSRLTRYCVVGSATHDVSVTGTQDVTGLGFTPTHLTLLMSSNGVSTQGSIAFYDGTNTKQRTLGPNAVVGNTYDGSTTGALLFYTAVGVVAYATVSFISGGFRLTWGKNGSPTGTAVIHFKAEA